METNTSLSLQEAADATGLNKSTIQRAIKRGDLSAPKDESGAYRIEPVELFRVFDPIPKTDSRTDDPVAQRDADPADATGRNAYRNSALEAEVKLLRERFEMTGQMHAERLKGLNTRIEELMQDRSDLRAERDKLLNTLQEQAISVRLLTHQTTTQAGPPDTPEPPVAAAAGSRRRLFGLFRR